MIMITKNEYECSHYLFTILLNSNVGNRILVYELSKMADEQDPSCTPVYYVGGSEVQNLKQNLKNNILNNSCLYAFRKIHFC